MCYTNPQLCSFNHCIVRYGLPIIAAYGHSFLNNHLEYFMRGYAHQSTVRLKAL